MMQLLEIRSLSAPNVWSHVPVMECKVVCDPISLEQLSEVFHRLRNLPRSTSPFECRQYPTAAHALVELALELQRQADCLVEFGDVRSTAFAHVWQLAFHMEEEPIGRVALEAACQLIESASNGHLDEIEAQVAKVREIAEEYRPGPTTRALIAAARKRSIPVYRLDQESLIQLGQGTKQHRLRMAATDRTGHIAEWIARDKLLTKRLLNQVGIPVAEGRQVKDANDACSAAAELGSSVVVKPCDSDYGNGVSIDLTDPSPIRTAYEHARRFSPNILVERYVPGYWHRLLVVNGQLVAAVRREPPRVVGDGQRSIRSLIEEYNADPRRGFGERFAYDPLVVCATVLGVLYRQGCSLESVPTQGTTVQLRQDAYLLRGASQSDVTDRVHPEIADIAVTAAETIGLDVAGIDLLCEDVSLPPDGQSLVVLEANAEPALVIHMAPVCTPSRPVAEQIVGSLFSAGDDGRVTVIVVVSDSELASELADDIRASGKITGFVSRSHSSLNGRTVRSCERSVKSRTQAIFMQRRLQVAVIQLTIFDILNEGLPVDRCDLLCVESLENDPDSRGSNSDRHRVIELLLSRRQFARETLMNAEHPSVRPHLPASTPQLAAAMIGCERQLDEDLFTQRTSRFTINEPLEFDGGYAGKPFLEACRERVRQFL